MITRRTVDVDLIRLHSMRGDLKACLDYKTLPKQAARLLRYMDKDIAKLIEHAEATQTAASEDDVTLSAKP